MVIQLTEYIKKLLQHFVAKKNWKKYESEERIKF